VVLEVTARTPDGKEIWTGHRHYHPQATTTRDQKEMYGAQWKVQNVRDTSLQPLEVKADTFEIPLPEGVRTVDVNLVLTYEINTPDNKIEIYNITKRVSLDRN
jgi:hypothetical protein